MDVTKLNSKQKEIYQALKKVIDPELKVNLVDLGLIYDIAIDKETAIITMTLTIMGCPLTELLNKRITDEVISVIAIKKCKINLVWYPRWTPKMMSQIARINLEIHI